MGDTFLPFSPSMVRGVVQGQKTQTRRAPKVSVAVGDRIWVREAWRAPACMDPLSGGEIAKAVIDAGLKKPWGPVKYEADGALSVVGCAPVSGWGRYRAGRYMPRWASRLILTVTDVRVERVQDISEADAIAEGIYFEAPTAADEAWYNDYHVEMYGAPPPVDDKMDGVWIAPGTRSGFGLHPETPKWGTSARGAFRWLWEDVNSPESWQENGLVKAITFTVAFGNIDAD
jgi:hypothetical protein